MSLNKTRSYPHREAVNDNNAPPVTWLLPSWLVWFVVILCVVPSILTLLGFDFGIEARPIYPEELIGANKSLVVDAAFSALSGAFVHTLLEWSAFCTAIFTVTLSFAHYSNTKNIVTPLVAMALFAAGCMDAFHTLAADRLFGGATDNRQLIPFTWAISRLFHASILALGVLLVLRRKRTKDESGKLRFLTLVGGGFGVAAGTIIWICSTSKSLPETMFPNSFITRPWDAIPLGLYLIAALAIFPRFVQMQNDRFSQALWLSLLPEIVTEAHMAFGSTALFDHHFNIAHTLKIGGYLIPFVGLCLEYIRAHDQVARTASELSKRQVELERSNTELERFAYAASHDLKAPLRAIGNLASWIEEDSMEKLDDESQTHLSTLRLRVKRMESLLNDLLAYSKVGVRGSTVESVCLHELIEGMRELLDIPHQMELIVDVDIPRFTTSRPPLEQVLLNLLSNAIKHHDSAEGKLIVSANLNDGALSISVKDDGPGVSPEFHDKIFDLYQTLHRRDDVEGNGMGLALVKKIVQSAGGEISIVSEGRGAEFVFSWPYSQSVSEVSAA